MMMTFHMIKSQTKTTAMGRLDLCVIAVTQQVLAVTQQVLTCCDTASTYLL